MGSRGLIRAVFLLLVCVCLTDGSPLETSTINCGVTSEKAFGPVYEGYTGDVELWNGIEPGRGVKLVSHLFPAHLEYLELIYAPGETTATVRTKEPLDADALAANDRKLHYAVVCDGAEKFKNSRTLQLIDINDNRPIFTQELYDVTVSEAVSVNSTVLTVRAVDEDSTPEHNQVSYSIDPASEDFAVTPGGAFILKRRLNYNVNHEHNFTVTARDNGGLNDTAIALIHVEDFDNLNPYFSHSVYRAFIPENQVGPFRVIQPEAIKAQDGDTGIDMSLIYSISSVSPERYGSNFRMDPDTGVVSVMTQIDREEMNSSVIAVYIQASQTDDRLKTAAAVLSVSVEDQNDNAPQFDLPQYDLRLLENSPVHTVVFKATVTDLDQGGFVGTLRLVPESVPFSVGADGTVRVRDSTLLDRESSPTFTFQIEAREGSPPNRVEQARVVVTLLDENDNSPTFTGDSYQGKVFANQTAGMVVAQVEAEDPDAGINGQISYSIEFGNKEGFFSINQTTGEITLLRTIPLEENKVLEFSLYVTATDGGAIPRSSSALVNIRAPGDSKPQFLQKVYHGTIAEEQDPGVMILKVTFLAVAAEVPVTLRVETEAEKFSISPSGELSTRLKLDYDEAPHSYSVNVSISDGATSDRAVVEVRVTDINDNPPVFPSASFTEEVPEYAQVGSNVTVVTATDKDSGFNKEIRYSVRGAEGKFSMDPVSGRLSVSAALDRETKASYQLLLLAEDQGRPARSSTATLLLQVLDFNDNAPKFSQAQYQVQVSETESVNATLITLAAVDPDEGENGRVTFSILRQSPPSEPAVFELDSSNGTLRLAGPLDFSAVRGYSLLVQASDGGTPPLVGTASVEVEVKDVNNNPPEFSQESYYVSVSENLASGASILTLKVTDRDQGGFSNGYFEYSSDTFDINRQGVVSLRKNVTLDRETKDSYILQVVAVDQPIGGLNATARLNVSVLDFNDNSPQFAELPEPISIPEGGYSEERPGQVITVLATDADLGPNADVTISLVSPHALFRFREDGMLLAVGPLDREKKDTYDLIIKASDKGIPQRESVRSISVSVTDINDNSPELSSSSWVASVLLKDAFKGRLLLTLAATDRDTGDNARITYSFSAGSSPYLALDGDSGAVTLTSDLSDITEDTTLVLTAMAADHGSPPLNSTARVVVNLRVVSLVEGVAFGASSYNFSLPENQPAGAQVGSVWASSGSNLYAVTYALRTHADLFSIDALGAIRARTPLDREQRDWFILEVGAVDTRTPPTSATAVVRVEVEDVNEPPQFLLEVYRASVFSIAPYKTPVVQVKATDPDVGEEGRLVYSLSSSSVHFDMDPSSGLLYTVSVDSLSGGASVALEVRATDPRGLHATAKVEVAVKSNASSSDIVIISLNQPANNVEKKVTQLEKSLGSALGWTVSIIDVSSANTGTPDSRQAAVKTLVSFICMDGGGEVVSSGQVTQKLQSQSAAVMSELIKVFGSDLHFDVEASPHDPSSSSDQSAAVIALAVLLALSMLGLIVTVVLIVRFKMADKHQENSDKESLDVGNYVENYSFWSRKTDESSGMGDTRSEIDLERTERQSGDSEQETGEETEDDNVKLDKKTDELETDKPTNDATENRQTDGGTVTQTDGQKKDTQTDEGQKKKGVVNVTFKLEEDSQDVEESSSSSL